MEFDLLKEIIVEILNVDLDEITEDTLFIEDLGADSLDVFQIIIGIEEKLNISINTESVESVKTVKDAIDLIKKTVAISVGTREQGA